MKKLKINSEHRAILLGIWNIAGEIPIGDLVRPVPGKHRRIKINENWTYSFIRKDLGYWKICLSFGLEWFQGGPLPETPPFTGPQTRLKYMGTPVLEHYYGSGEIWLDEIALTQFVLQYRDQFN